CDILLIMRDLFVFAFNLRARERWDGGRDKEAGRYPAVNRQSIFSSRCLDEWSHLLQEAESEHV
ncbi:MAG: hypothetical protein AAAB35_00165, partial [Phyllobacterium sp.]|uniref:hypothetical protein n=1 Tax=Phyllobacterium sp. TaxID=1871046 RepID=UPI0030F2DBBA